MREFPRDSRDGEVICHRCQTNLNRTDRLCWKCGSEKLDIVGTELMSLMAVREDEEALVQQDYINTLFKGRGQSGGTFVPPPGYPVGSALPGATNKRIGALPGVAPVPYAGTMKMITCPHGLKLCPSCKRYMCSSIGTCVPCFRVTSPGYAARCPAGDPNNVIQP